MNTVIIISGPYGAGKSIISHNLALKFKKSVNLHADEIRNMIIKGHEDPGQGTDESTRQQELTIKNICLLANNFTDENFVVIIDDIIYNKDLHKWKSILNHSKLFLFVLLPDLKTCMARDKERYSKAIMQLPSAIIRLQHRKLKEQNTAERHWITVDNTETTVEQTVEMIYGYIK